jgi:hypothetical protein
MVTTYSNKHLLAIFLTSREHKLPSGNWQWRYLNCVRMYMSAYVKGQKHYMLIFVSQKITVIIEYLNGSKGHIG